MTATFDGVPIVVHEGPLYRAGPRRMGPPPQVSSIDGRWVRAEEPWLMHTCGGARGRLGAVIEDLRWAYLGRKTPREILEDMDTRVERWELTRSCELLDLSELQLPGLGQARDVIDNDRQQPEHFAACHAALAPYRASWPGGFLLPSAALFTERTVLLPREWQARLKLVDAGKERHPAEVVDYVIDEISLNADFDLSAA